MYRGIVKIKTDGWQKSCTFAEENTNPITNQIKTFIMKINILMTVLVSLCIACGDSHETVNNTPVSKFELHRYLGNWYEIARFDHSFERGMEYCKAHYRLREDGKVEVTNTGIKNGKSDTAKGKAKTTDVPALLKVSFFGPFYADYRVLMIDPDYRYVLVGGSNDKYLWIMSRTPQIDDATKSNILAEAQRRGYDTSLLIWVKQDV